jgi:hypothetical protein
LRNVNEKKILPTPSFHLFVDKEGFGKGIDRGPVLEPLESGHEWIVSGTSPSQQSSGRKG